MSRYSVCLVSLHPCHHVVHVDTPRGAQITARRLGERFTSCTFDVARGPNFQRPGCHAEIREHAISPELQRLVDAELIVEVDANPGRLLKWCAFRFRDGSVSACLEHDLAALKRCRSDFDLVEERAIFAQRVSPGKALDCFRQEANIHVIP